MENKIFIGSGAFSQVYRLQEEDTNRMVACKVSERKDLLCREGELLKRLTHPLFPKYYGMRQDGEMGDLYMEYVAGNTLEALLARRGRMTAKQGIEIAVELAEGILTLHELQEQVLYLDLKPENIIIREDGGVALVDMGSAGTAEQLKGILTGTKGYAAPEQLRAGGKIGTYSDVYALGKVMRCMCSYYGRGMERLLEECLQERIHERIPDMRYFLRRVAPYRRGQKRNGLIMGIKEPFRRLKRGEIVFEKNIIKILL